MLDLDPNRPPVAPVDAATLILLRDGSHGLDVFCVRRTQRSTFMAGAIVFPGGRVEPDDHDPGWHPLVQPSSPRLLSLGDRDAATGFAVAACRECLEEAAILPVDRRLSHDDALALRATLADGPLALRRALSDRRLKLDLSALVPFARWITPAAERRRFDARFFMLRAPEGQPGAHDAQETTESFWASPADVLARWDRNELQLAPPTHHTLRLLTSVTSVDEALALAAERSLEPITPQLVQRDGESALVPNRPLDGIARYVLRGEQWRPEQDPLYG